MIKADVIKFNKDLYGLEVNEIKDRTDIARFCYSILTYNGGITDVLVRTFHLDTNKNIFEPFSFEDMVVDSLLCTKKNPHTFKEVKELVVEKDEYISAYFFIDKEQTKTIVISAFSPDMRKILKKRYKKDYVISIDTYDNELTKKEEEELERVIQFMKDSI